MSKVDEIGNISRRALIGLCIAAGAGMAVYLAGNGPLFLMVVLNSLLEVGAAGAILAACGGWGYPVIRRLAPKAAPTPLKVVTAVALGLWMASILVLLVGSFTTGLLKAWLWWPVVALGVALAVWQARRTMEAWRPSAHHDARAMVWVVLAACVGMWLAGANRPPGFIGMPDAYDVLEYHLQVPRQYYIAQHIAQMTNNVYSYYPSQTGMLYLLAMALRGGAYEGMYLATLMHGLFAALAVAAVVAGLKDEPNSRGRFSAALLATTPLALYLCWMAMSELPSMAYLAIAVLWLRQWITYRRAKEALCIGLMIGAACATKYVAIGTVAAPVLAAMLLVRIVHRRPPDATRAAARPGAGHLGTAIFAALIVLSPWLVRNTLYTGNPVFPLATGTLGRGHWSAQTQMRWDAGTGSETKPPVPIPPGWQAPLTAPTRAERFFRLFLTNELLGPLTLIAAILAVCALLARFRREDLWDWSLLVILVGQLAAWTAMSHEMPTRFIVPAIVPLCLLAGGATARLWGVERNPFSKSATAGPIPWGRAPAMATMAIAVLVNIVIAARVFSATTGDAPIPPESGQTIAKYLYPSFPDGSRLMLIGDAKAFYLPPDTIYATPFDDHPLAEMAAKGLSPEQILKGLHDLGVTHIWVDWLEVERLAQTYGCPEPLSDDILIRAERNLPPRLAVIERLSPLGVRPVAQIVVGAGGGRTLVSTSQPAAQTASSLPAAATGEGGASATQAAGPAGGQRGAGASWPLVTIYAMPWASHDPPVMHTPSTQPGE